MKNTTTKTDDSRVLVVGAGYAGNRDGPRADRCRPSRACHRQAPAHPPPVTIVVRSSETCSRGGWRPDRDPIQPGIERSDRQEDDAACNPCRIGSATAAGKPVGKLAAAASMTLGKGSEPAPDLIRGRTVVKQVPFHSDPHLAPLRKLHNLIQHQQYLGKGVISYSLHGVRTAISHSPVKGLGLVT